MVKSGKREGKAGKQSTSGNTSVGVPPRASHVLIMHVLQRCVVSRCQHSAGGGAALLSLAPHAPLHSLQRR